MSGRSFPNWLFLLQSISRNGGNQNIRRICPMKFSTWPNFFYMYRIIYVYLHYGIEDFLALFFKPPLLTKNYRYLQSMFLTYDKWCSILQWYLHYIILLFVQKKTFQGIVIKIWRKNESIKIISHHCSNRYTIQLMFGMVSYVTW